MEFLEKLSALLNEVLMGVAGFFIASMIILTCANVFLRLVWVPLSGTFELMGYCSAVAMAFALAFTQRKRGHVAVDILVYRFSKKTQRALNCLNSLVCMVFFLIIPGYGKLSIKSTFGTYFSNYLSLLISCTYKVRPISK